MKAKMLDAIHENIENQIKEIFEINAHDPSAIRKKCLALLDEKCQKGAELDPLVGSYNEPRCYLYGLVAASLANSGFISAAQEVLIEAWQKFQIVQKNEHSFIYKAGISVRLSDLYHRLGDIGAAIRWALITHADDALVNYVNGGAQQRLQEIFGMTENALSAINTIASNNNNRINNEYEGDWASSLGFAEDVLIRFVLKHQEFASLFAHSSSVSEFPISNVYFGELLARSNQLIGTDGKEKYDGTALEDLASYLFLLIPGWIPRRNVITVHGEYETDIIVSDLTPTSNLRAELFGRNFLVECKNWKKPVGTNQVGYFLYRMRLTHTKFGVIFAREGITGEQNDSHDAKAASNLINRAFHEDGNICIVINYEELQWLAENQLSFWSLILDKARTIQFGVSRYR